MIVAWAHANYIISNPQNTRAWLVYGKEASAKLAPLLTTSQLNGATSYLTPYPSANEYIRAVAPRRLFPPATKTRGNTRALLWCPL